MVDEHQLLGCRVVYKGISSSTRGLTGRPPCEHLVDLRNGGIATQSAYNSAKFAVRGFTESLQAEYWDSPLTVTCVHPGGIATNIALRARTDGEAADVSDAERDQAFKQVARTTPEKAAQVILKGTLAGRRRVFIGWDAWLMHTLTKFLPTSYHAITAKLGSAPDDKG